MSTILTNEQRSLLNTTVQAARAAAEVAASASLTALAVAETHRPSYLDDERNDLRLALRAKARQLGDDVTARDAELTLLIHDVAYEQWHRLLFARFLERNGLLRHAEFPDTPVSLQDCDDLATAGEIDEPDGWSVAARFAAQLLPGVFRLDDPAFRVRLATEHRQNLERLLMAIPDEVFEAEDALGWVYQFWQTAEKKRVNDTGDKIGGANLSPVTQLFTENYMVRFLLENSLGAWWAARHPESPLVDGWEYLRFLDDGTPAAGTFAEWPARAADVTVMDPCCGSGHFLVAMFGMLWRMRAEEDGLTDADAQDAVLRDNLFGLELDARCTQIAMFNVALEAWKQGGYREIPTPQIACSGVPVRQTREEWLDGVPEHLRDPMAALHSQFHNADTLGSLIDPRPTDAGRQDGTLFGRDLQIGVTWDELQPHIAAKFANEGTAGSVLGQATEDVLQSAALLARNFTLIATNPPFLSAKKMGDILLGCANQRHPEASGNLAYAMLDRWTNCQTAAFVVPQGWRFQTEYTALRKLRLERPGIMLVAAVGVSAFSAPLWDFHTDLIVDSTGNVHRVIGCDASNGASPTAVAHLLRRENLRQVPRESQLHNVDHRITFTETGPAVHLSEFASGLQGIKTGDDARYRRSFWEIGAPVGPKWERFLTSVRDSGSFGGRSFLVAWENGTGAMATSPGARIVGKGAWGKSGVLVSQMGNLPITLYTGELFDTNASPVIPHNPKDLPAIRAFLSSPEYAERIRVIDTSLKVTNRTLVKVPFDKDHWESVANATGPLDEPHSDDPTQWLFRGEMTTSTQPLQVGVSRLLGYRWPDQEADTLDGFTDADGIVALSDLGEGGAASRLRELLATVFRDRWSSALEHTLVNDAGGTTGRLEDWLRDTFFAHHCKVFDNRPFIWHVWDGRKDGFSALLHYHRLDRPTLEKLTYTTLGAWIRRQEHEVEAETAGAEARLAAAQQLQRTLELIIEGDDPHDIYVRWKGLHEQPVGWAPDIDDGVRLNIRPFVTANVLRTNLSTKIKWTKDRGKNPDGSDRINDLHPTLAERRAARAQHEAGPA